MRKILVKNTKLYRNWSSLNISIFQTNAWFFGNNKALPRFSIAELVL